MGLEFNAKAGGSSSSSRSSHRHDPTASTDRDGCRSVVRSESCWKEERGISGIGFLGNEWRSASVAVRVSCSPLFTCSPSPLLLYTAYTLAIPLETIRSTAINGVMNNASSVRPRQKDPCPTKSHRQLSLIYGVYGAGRILSQPTGLKGRSSANVISSKLHASLGNYYSHGKLYARASEGRFMGNDLFDASLHRPSKHTSGDLLSQRSDIDSDESVIAFRLSGVTP